MRSAACGVLLGASVLPRSISEAVGCYICVRVSRNQFSGEMTARPATGSEQTSSLVVQAIIVATLETKVERFKGNLEKLVINAITQRT